MSMLPVLPISLFVFEVEIVSRLFLGGLLFLLILKSKLR